MAVFSYDSIDNAFNYNYRAKLIFDSGSEYGDNDFSFAVHSCLLPQISTDPLEINVGGYKYKYPSTPTYNEISLTLYCDFDEKIIDKLYTWQTECYSTEKIATVYSGTTNTDNSIDTSFKNSTDFIVELFTPTTVGATVAGTWYFRGAWPQQISYGERSYDSAEPLSISLTLAYQYAEFAIPKS